MPFGLFELAVAARVDFKLLPIANAFLPSRKPAPLFDAAAAARAGRLKARAQSEWDALQQELCG